jgi:hydroxymethylbilane synthase
MPMVNKVRIGSRKSSLALQQSELVKTELLKVGVDQVDIIPFDTSGDQNQKQCFSEFGGRGIFTQEIEKALLHHKIDIAVHSLKDLPVDLEHPFHLAGVLKREDPHDVFVSCRYSSIDQMPPGSTIGTSSIRRKAFLVHYRPDLQCKPLRGNVQTRLRKCKNADIDGSIMAMAGLRRCNLQSQIRQVLPYSWMIPSPGQGAIAMETLAQSPTRSIVESITHIPSFIETACERQILQLIGGGCHTPFGAIATTHQDMLHIEACLSLPDGSLLCQSVQQGPALNWEELSQQVFLDLQSNGLNEILSKMKCDENEKS